jgi:hypothetical protein
MFTDPFTVSELNSIGERTYTKKALLLIISAKLSDPFCENNVLNIRFG